MQSPKAVPGEGSGPPKKQKLVVHNGSWCLGVAYFFGGLVLFPGLLVAGISLYIAQLLSYIIAGLLWLITGSLITKTNCFGACWNMTKNHLWFNVGTKLIITPFIWIYYALKQRHVHGVVMGASTEDTIRLIDEEAGVVNSNS